MGEPCGSLLAQGPTLLQGEHPLLIASRRAQPGAMLRDGSWLSTGCADRLDLPPEHCDKTAAALHKITPTPPPFEGGGKGPVLMSTVLTLRPNTPALHLHHCKAISMGYF